jgi:hypothetical protein
MTQRNAYYFWHYTQLGQLSPRIGDIQAKVSKDRYRAYREGFCYLNAAGLLKDEQIPGQYDRIIHALQILCIHWLPQSRLDAHFDFSAGFSQCLWAILFPLLTEQGVAAYHRDITGYTE